MTQAKVAQDSPIAVEVEEGKSYFVNTSGFHTAVNYGDDNRYHIVGVRYENSTDRTH